LANQVDQPSKLQWLHVVGMTVCPRHIKMQAHSRADDMTLETEDFIANAVFFLCPNSNKRAPDSPSILQMLVGAS
jgi:hypothetical protein